MEGTGIIVRGHIGAIVRDNNVHNFFNGIYTGSSGALENPSLHLMPISTITISIILVMMGWSRKALASINDFGITLLIRC